MAAVNETMHTGIKSAQHSCPTSQQHGISYKHLAQPVSLLHDVWLAGSLTESGYRQNVSLEGNAGAVARVQEACLLLAREDRCLEGCKVLHHAEIVKSLLHKAQHMFFCLQQRCSGLAFHCRGMMLARAWPYQLSKVPSCWAGADHLAHKCLDGWLPTVHAIVLMGASLGCAAAPIVLGTCTAHVHVIVDVSSLAEAQLCPLLSAKRTAACTSEGLE